MLVRIGAAVVAIGFGIQLFSGFTWTVESPDDCPESWEGDDVTVTEVYDTDGSLAGYWCLVPGAFTQANEPTFQNIPVGERSGYSQAYGFGVMVLGGLLIGAGLLAKRSSGEPGTTGADSDREVDDGVS